MNVSIDELIELLDLQDTDVFAVVDISEVAQEKTKKIKALTLLSYVLNNIELTIPADFEVTEKQGIYTVGTIIPEGTSVIDVVLNMLTGVPTGPTLRQPTATMSGSIFNSSYNVGDEIPIGQQVIVTYNVNNPTGTTYGMTNGRPTLPADFVLTYRDETESIVTQNNAVVVDNGSTVVATFTTSSKILVNTTENLSAVITYYGGTDGSIGTYTFTNTYKSGTVSTNKNLTTSTLVYWDYDLGLLKDSQITEARVLGLNQISYPTNVDKSFSADELNATTALTLVIAVPTPNVVTGILNKNNGLQDELTSTVTIGGVPVQNGPKQVIIGSPGVTYNVYWKLLNNASPSNPVDHQFKITLS